MKKQALPIEGAFLLEPQVFGDERGCFFEFYNEEKFRGLELSFTPKQANFSRSAKGVLRGLHFQHPPKAMGKLVQCTSGAIFDVIVDLRKSSPTYLQWVGFELSAQNRRIMFVPSYCAHGFFAYEDSDVLYLTSETFDPTLDANIRFDEPEIGVEWPLSGVPILSGRDEKAPRLADTNIRF